MTRHTPPRVVNVESLFPEVVPYRKDAVRLHPRAGEPTHRDSSVGGPLLWPVQEPWPECPEHTGSPMVPVVQIYRADVPGVVPFPAECDLLQVLWCPRIHDGRWIVPEIHWRRASDVEEMRDIAPVPVQPAYGHVPKPCVVHPELVTEYASWDLPDHVWDALEDRFTQVETEAGWDYQSHLSTAPGTKLGGWPGWTQEPQWPNCVSCGMPMEHLLTVESVEADAGSRHAWTPVEDHEIDYEGPGLILGDLGGVYLFECRTCPGRPCTHRFDCP